MKFDYTNLQSAMKEFAKDSGKSKREVCRLAARGFVKDIVGITPPASKGVAGIAAKKAGEAAIASDLSRIFMVMSDANIRSFEALNGKEAESQFGHEGAKAIGTVKDRVLSRGEMTAWHAARRTKDGRVVGGGNGGQLNRTRAASLATGIRKKDLPSLDIGIVSKSDMDWFRKTLQKMVGFLAAGWNFAAGKLGVNLPAWVKRHGSTYGDHKVKETATTVRIEVENSVGFVGNVRAYDRRVQRAIDYQGRKMIRQSEVLLKKRLRKAGFR